jgi:hypothetical protein
MGLPQQSLYDTKYWRPSAGLRHVPIQVTADISVPGGHDVAVPPQQLDMNPSIEQYRQ